MSQARCPRCGGIFETPGEPPRRRVRCPECGRCLRASRRGSSQVPSWLPWFSDRWFHVVMLPAVWLLAVVPLWIIACVSSVWRSFPVYLAVLPANLWAAGIAWFIPLDEDEVSTHIVMTVAGLLFVAFVGLAQDLLRVSWSIVVAYTLSIAGVALYLLRFNSLSEGGDYRLDYCMCLCVLFCMCLYAWSLLSCLAFAVYQVNNWLNARAVARQR